MRLTDGLTRTTDLTRYGFIGPWEAHCSTGRVQARWPTLLRWRCWAGPGSLGRSGSG